MTTTKTVTKLSELAAVIKITTLDNHLEALHYLGNLRYNTPLKCLDDEKNIFVLNADRNKPPYLTYFLVLDPVTKNTYGTRDPEIKERVPTFYEGILVFKKSWVEPELTPSIAERFEALNTDYNPFKMGSPYKDLDSAVPDFDDSSSPIESLEILDNAKTIQQERGQEYDQGSRERNIGRVVAAFNAIHGTTLTEAQGWHFMTLLKAVRLFSTETFHLDSAVDLVSYAALTGEAKSQEY